MNSKNVRIRHGYIYNSPEGPRAVRVIRACKPTLRGWFLCRDSATREKFTTHAVMLSEVPDRPGLMDPTGDDDGMVDLSADRAFFGGF